MRHHQQQSSTIHTSIQSLPLRRSFDPEQSMDLHNNNANLPNRTDSIQSRNRDLLDSNQNFDSVNLYHQQSQNQHHNNNVNFSSVKSVENTIIGDEVQMKITMDTNQDPAQLLSKAKNITLALRTSSNDLKLFQSIVGSDDLVRKFDEFLLELEQQRDSITATILR